MQHGTVHDTRRTHRGQPQITVQKIQVPAHSSLPWHTHSMPIAGYVVSGELTVEKTDGEKKTVRAGQVLPETVGSVHRGVPERSL